MKIKFFMLMMLIIVLIAGTLACSQPATPPPPSTTPPPSSTPTPTVTPTSSPTLTTNPSPTPTTTPSPTPTPTPPVTPSPTPTKEVEATEFMGKKLTPISQQRNNALAGTQIIDRATYRLVVDGLVEKPLSLSYDDLLAYPQESRLMDLDCVEGWNFTAKWTGPSLNAIFNDAGLKPEAKIVIFDTADVPDGYSSLDLSYVQDNDIIIALKLNDITLPPDRGFPFQVVAMSKFGYKWAKWVTRIEISDDTSFRGYWESYGYSNNADVNGPAFGP
jgi:DMSO/TMAO reductase YedYZ molybdopterin-dependent catalytic subunit